MGDEQLSWCQKLYDAKAAELILYGRALSLSHAEAEDVVHETFLALLRRAEAPERPEHYCVSAFRNRVFNYRRNLWRRLTRELESQAWFEPSAGADQGEAAATQALSEIPVEQREVIVLKIWHDYTFEEIGELLGVSPNTIAARYRYGLQKVRASLKGDAHERPESLGDPLAGLDAQAAFRRAPGAGFRPSGG